MVKVTSLSTSSTAPLSGFTHLYPVIRKPRWWLIDAQGQRVGRLASQISMLLQGKHKPIFTPAVDCGDFVVVVNSSKVEFTGQKWEKKRIRWHTGYPGGLKERIAGDYHTKFPDRILQNAILGMLPKNNLREVRENRLRIFAGPDHNHHPQEPVPYALHRTKGADQTAPWGLVPEYKVSFELQPSPDGERDVWVMKTEAPHLAKRDRNRLRWLKKKGLLGPSHRKEPHPDGYERAGFPSGVLKPRKKLV